MFNVREKKKKKSRTISPQESEASSGAVYHPELQHSATDLRSEKPSSEDSRDACLSTGMRRRGPGRSEADEQHYTDDGHRTQDMRSWPGSPPVILTVQDRQRTSVDLSLVLLVIYAILITALAAFLGYSLNQSVVELSQCVVEKGKSAECCAWGKYMESTLRDTQRRLKESLSQWGVFRWLSAIVDRISQSFRRRIPAGATPKFFDQYPLLEEARFEIINPELS
eukprot:scpid84548/ scgid9090/ 